ncbi:MAG: hypothetical protein IPJ69_12840 [Deltaproteobacteria bacterium]|nr:MAG: hypothetical protein IPJ69_12840 [Deltaproteobacteria bacterium]
MRSNFNLFTPPLQSTWDYSNFFAHFSGDASSGTINMPLVMAHPGEVALGKRHKLVCPPDSILNVLRIHRGKQELPKLETPEDISKKIAMMILEHSRAHFGHQFESKPFNGCYEVSRKIGYDQSQIAEETLKIRNKESNIQLKIARSVRRDEGYKNEVHLYLGWVLGGAEVYMRVSKNNKTFLVVEVSPPLLNGLGIIHEKSFLEWTAALSVSQAEIQDSFGNQRNNHLVFIHTQDRNKQTIAGHESPSDLKAGKKPSLYSTLDKTGLKLRIRYGNPKDLSENYLKGALKTFLGDKMPRDGSLRLALYR